MSDLFVNPDDYSFDDEVSLDVDEKNAGGSKQEWLKMTKGQVLRCAFVYFHTYDANAVRAAKKENRTLESEKIAAVAKDALVRRAAELHKSVDQLTVIDKLDPSTVNFKAMKVHYQDGLGYVLSRLGKDGPEADLIWKRLTEPKTYFSTLLLIYPTDSEGNLEKEGLASQIKNKKLKMMPWRFGSPIYDDIWKLNDGLRKNKLALASQDIKLECTDAQYQKIKVSSDGPSIWPRNEMLKEAVLTTAYSFYDKLSPFREVSTTQLKEKLGLTGSAVQDVSVDNMQDLIDQV
jgi:hypothetical protein